MNLSELEQAFAGEPANLACCLHLALALKEQLQAAPGSKERLFTLLEHIFTLDPGNVKAYLLRQELVRLLGCDDSTFPRSIAELTPCDAEDSLLLAWHLLARGKVRQAKAWFDYAARLNPQAVPRLIQETADEQYQILQLDPHALQEGEEEEWNGDWDDLWYESTDFDIALAMLEKAEAQRRDEKNLKNLEARLREE